MPSGLECDPAQLGETVKGHARVLVYAGVRLNPYTETYRALEDRLALMGRITDRATFGTDGMTYVVELSGAELTMIGNRQQVAKDSTTDAGHSHTVTFN